MIWETEEDRDMGNSFMENTYDDKETAIERAKKLFYREPYACLEVWDKEETIFHISTDVPIGERYDVLQ